MCHEQVIRFDSSQHDLRGVVVSMLEQAGDDVGWFGGPERCHATPSNKLESFFIPSSVLELESSQQRLSDLVGSNTTFLGAYESFVRLVILPHLKAQLAQALSLPADTPTTFYYQFPPTLRLQPGPSSRYVRRHHDGEYGHQRGELNFWMPLTDHQLTCTTLWIESREGEEDDHPIWIEWGEVLAFHGSVCRHFVPANSSSFTRVSIDFRVGVDGYFDPHWSMRGTQTDHDRRSAVL